MKYDFRGTMKYAAYYIGENSDFIVIVSADEAEVLEDANSFAVRTLFIVLLHTDIQYPFVFCDSYMVYKPGCPVIESCT